MEVYSPASRRLWRPAAQRQVRNAWSALAAHRAAWVSSSAAALSAATSLVNSCLVNRYMAAMDLGVLGEMEGIREGARTKLKAQQEGFMEELLGSYEHLVEVVSEMRKAANSMRTYLRSADGPLIGFSNEQMVEGDLGDGGGMPIFASLSLQAFEKLATEVLSMHQAELEIKWLLTADFQVAGVSGGEDAHNQQKRELDQEKLRMRLSQDASNADCFSADSTTFKHIVETFKRRRRTCELERESLQVYLTALLAEVNVNKQRLEDIFALVSEEVGIESFFSPKKPA